MRTTGIKKRMRRFIIGAAVTALILGFFVYIARVQGGWVLPPQAPPAGNVPEPLHIGSIPSIQSKPGDLGVADIFTADTQKWASEFWHFAPTYPLNISLFLGNTLPSANVPAASNLYVNWQPRTVSISTAAFEDPPPGVRRRIRAFVIRAICSDVYMWLTGEATPPAPAPGITEALAGNWRLACAATRNVPGVAPLGINDTYDTSTVVLPVTHTVPANAAFGGSVTVYAHFTDPWSAAIPSAPVGGQFTVQRAEVIGYYYTDQPLAAP